MLVENLLQNIPEKLPDELIQTLVNSKNVRVERIISKGHQSKKDHWYDQDQNEWVMVLQGQAELRFEGEKILTVLEKGDYINIPAHTRHRVEWTDPHQETIWLAIFY